MTGAQDILKPGDVLAIRTGGFAGELIRVGEELTGKIGLENHIAVCHHWLDGVPWGLQGEPGGVGWIDLRAYLASPYTVTNAGQPGRSDETRATVAKEAGALLGDRYDWAAIGGDALAALHVHLWNLKFPHGLAPGEVVCSSFAAWLYEQAGWPHPDAGTERDCEPADWCAWIMDHGWNVPLSSGLRLEAAWPAGSPRTLTRMTRCARSWTCCSGWT
jgi:hypothetical protein